MAVGTLQHVVDFLNAWIVLAIAQSTSTGGKTGFLGFGDFGFACSKRNYSAKPLVGRAITHSREAVLCGR